MYFCSNRLRLCLQDICAVNSLLQKLHTHTQTHTYTQAHTHTHTHAHTHTHTHKHTHTHAQTHMHARTHTHTHTHTHVHTHTRVIFYLHALYNHPGGVQGGSALEPFSPCPEPALLPCPLPPRPVPSPPGNTYMNVNFRVGQNRIYAGYMRYFWQENHQIYGQIRCIYTVLANPNVLTSSLHSTTSACAFTSR